MPGLMTFRATSRLIGSDCAARKTPPHATLTDLLKQLERADDGAGTFRDLVVSDSGFKTGFVEQVARLQMCGQQGFHPLPHIRVVGARLGKIIALSSR
jgi:hypothetical protein